MYEVIHFFTDLQDFCHEYHVGDTFPRHGVTASDERIAELSGSDNKQNKPLIRAVETGYTRTSIARMNKSDLLALAEQEALSVDQDVTLKELKEILLTHFGL